MDIKEIQRQRDKGGQYQTRPNRTKDQKMSDAPARNQSNSSHNENRQQDDEITQLEINQFWQNRQLYSQSLTNNPKSPVQGRLNGTILASSSDPLLVRGKVEEAKDKYVYFVIEQAELIKKSNLLNDHGKFVF